MHLGNVYEESVDDVEYKRLAVTPTGKMERNEYHREIPGSPDPHRLVLQVNPSHPVPDAGGQRCCFGVPRR